MGSLAPPKPPTRSEAPRRSRGAPRFPDSPWGPRKAPPSLAPDLHAREPFEHLDDGGPVLLAQAGRSRHLVDLLAHVGQQERHTELFGKSRFELLVLVRDG